MYGNGVGIGMISLIIKVVQVAIRGVQIEGLAASVVAAAGSATMTTAVWLVATTIVLAVVASIWAFAL